MKRNSKQKTNIGEDRSFEKTSINWFPGHMAKTLREIEAQLKNVDMVAELVDARIPLSSRNPVLAGLIGDKPELIILNKSDLADREMNARWLEYYRSKGFGAIEMCAKERSSVKLIDAAVESTLSIKRQLRESKGMSGQKERIMVIGVPNVGKSTLINMLTGNSIAKVENRPGVTRGKQWISSKDYDLLDMPGTLWPKLSNRHSSYLLAFIGSIKDDILDISELSTALIDLIRDNYKDRLTERFGIEYSDDNQPYEILEMIARKRGMVLRGNEPDIERAAKMLLSELRKGALGRITFEEPGE